PELALQTLAAPELKTARGRWIKGMTQLDAGDIDQAKDTLRASRQQDETFVPARAYSLLVEELEHSNPHQTIDTAMEQLLQRHPRNRDVLRAAARALMHVARVSDDRAGRDELL